MINHISPFIEDCDFLELLFYYDGALSRTAGQIVGVGPGRGIGFLFVISGLLVSVLALVMGRVKKIGALEQKTVGAAG